MPATTRSEWATVPWPSSGSRRRDDPADLAGITTRVGLGTAVLLPALHHQVVLAQQLANIDLGRGSWGGRRLSLDDYVRWTGHEWRAPCRRLLKLPVFLSVVQCLAG